MFCMKFCSLTMKILFGLAWFVLCLFAVWFCYLAAKQVDKCIKSNAKKKIEIEAKSADKLRRR